jgi:hypothetical protein
MGVRAYLGSPVAVAWTLAAVAGVGAVVAAGWRVAAALASVSVLSNPAFLGGAGAVVVPLFVAGAVTAVAGAVWLPCGAAIAYAVGRAVRGQRATLPASAAVVRSRAEPLYRWAKTAVAVGPVADRVLTESDVSRAEIAVGCGGFVVPALVLDAPTLPAAVERANRILPGAGRRRVRVAGGVATVTLAVAAGAIGGIGAGAGAGTGGSVELLPPAPALALAGLVVGGVVTAAVDTARRAEIYAAASRDDGFRG